MARPNETLEGAAAYRAADWLIRHHSIRIVPSIQGLEARQLPRSDAPLPFLGIGAPIIGNGTPRSLPSLEGAAAELEDTRAAMPPGQGTLLLGPNASKNRLLHLSETGDLARYRVLAFATHGLLAAGPAVPEPALLLSPAEPSSKDDKGLLLASEIATLKLSADLVVLSACNTAAGYRREDFAEADALTSLVDHSNSEAMSGLAKAFILAGTRSLMISHWKVQDAAAAQLTTGVFRARESRPDLTLADALQLTMLEFLRPERPPEDADPSRWAPFFVVGDLSR